MVGGGKKKDDGSAGINSTNVFAALDSLRRKKKSDKEHGSSKNKGSSKTQAKEPEPPVFWASASLSGKSWADVDDDDDYYATTAPPQAVWGASEQHDNKGTSTPIEESESEEDGLDEGDEDIDVEEEQDIESEVPVPTEHAIKKPSPATVVPKEAERQLSKKELKKKELAELEAVLAEFGLQNNNGQDEPHGSVQEKETEPNGDITKENAPVITESKSAKKKKAKKDKSSKDAKDALDQPNGSDNTAADEATGLGPVEEDTPSIDVKERIKKVTSMKKKKSNKELDAAAKAAAMEAAARSARLAAAKKKEKNHYNQQPVR
eukprot:TRINITY_DN1202_c0_g1_i1.p1 TRINITY_DN1202_c0_g1~~TRINITY_DN1202_c0_g1_i1.p1  ORF type:complete len:320 (+),score=117.62 TRINITY_DN1202_c0_g1_i1:801-1760(+)